MTKGLFHHIEIYVSDLKRSTEFWGWFLEELGYTTFQEWNGGQSWKLEDTYIVFVQTEERFLDVPYHRCRVGLNHLAFHADSRQHVDEMLEKLNTKGINILYEDKLAIGKPLKLSPAFPLLHTKDVPVSQHPALHLPIYN
ncbi:VOC family protein [Virgibacillus siamensis]|uniref:VOC family protein n=1 Tax=Virgibacillus siamensis TaxID=480071 RepID=UPI00098764DA|nr:VOC family protein [Virgibacillus siamensis]